MSVLDGLAESNHVANVLRKPLRWNPERNHFAFLRDIEIARICQLQAFDISRLVSFLSQKCTVQVLKKLLHSLKKMQILY